MALFFTGMKKYAAAFALDRRVLRISVAVTFVLSFTTACLGHTIFSMPVTIGMIVCWTVAVGGSWVLGIGLNGGLIALWCALILDENIRGLIFIRRWKSRHWTTKSLV